ncbi:hypothetical protein MBT84_42750 [Streptomyces sp. MBT84]|nr:hypothetical protein [Streptomyces sp. MBT84]
MSRSRTFEWEDPRVSAAAVGQQSGLDFLRSVISGRLPAPPIAATLGFTLEQVELGSAVFALEPGRSTTTPSAASTAASTPPSSTRPPAAPCSPSSRQAWATPRST